MAARNDALFWRIGGGNASASVSGGERRFPQMAKFVEMLTLWSLPCPVLPRWNDRFSCPASGLRTQRHQAWSLPAVCSRECGSVADGPVSMQSKLADML
jgi:hypothetical protein